MTEVMRAKAPWHLWVVGVASLLWHAGGAFDYVQSQLANREYLAQMAAQYTIPVDRVVAYIQSYPVWADSAWAIGVWAAVLGSILLLFRSRFAFHAFLLSIAGTSIAFVYQFTNPLEGFEPGPFAIGFAVAIFLVEVLLIRYAKVMTKLGILR